MTLGKYIEKLQSHGKYHFSKAEALEELQCSEISLIHAVHRLKKKKKIAVPKPNFFVIVPVEYKAWGVVPANWFIDSLMNFLGRSYYVGLLSAAALYGAAHQAPQQFQVVVTKPLRTIKEKRVVIKFLKNDQLPLIPTRKVQTQTGYMNVSSPEATALDLIKYYSKVGYFSHIATVLAELKEQLKPDLLVSVFQNAHYEWPILQRLGYLLSLEAVGGQDIIEPIRKLIVEHKPKLTSLAPYKGLKDAPINEHFRVYVNEDIEVDDV